MARTAALHLGLMLTTMAMVYILPFELLLLSYAVLGPLHYLTEISWLHDRGYFLPTKPLAVFLACLVSAAFFLVSTPWFGIMLWIAFLACVLAVAGRRMRQQAMLLIFVGATIAALINRQVISYAIAVLLPTVVHVSLFTIVFMIVGAHRARSRLQALMVLVYILIVGFILVIPPGCPPVMSHSVELDQEYFGSIGIALGFLIGMPKLALDGRIAGLLSFIYTYHYLNWFLKAEIIGWRRMPTWRLMTIAAIAIASTGLYFYDFALGITVLTTLSLAHVVMEFPLNVLSLRSLAEVTAHRATSPIAVTPASSL